MKAKILSAAALVAFLAPGLVSCVDKNYDMNKYNPGAEVKIQLPENEIQSANLANLDIEGVVKNADGDFVLDSQGAKVEAQVVGDVAKSTGVELGSLTIETGKSIPDFLKGADYQLADPGFFIEIDNPSDVDMKVSGVLEPVFFKGSASGKEFGGFTIPAKQKIKAFVSAEGISPEAGAVGIKIDGLGDIIPRIPEKINITDLKLTPATATKALGGRNAEKLTFSAIAGMYTKLSFKPGAKIELEFKLADFGYKASDFGFDGSFSNVEIKADITSTIPFTFEAEGSSPKGTKASVAPAIAGGEINKPATTSVKASVQLAGDINDLDNVVVKITATNKMGKTVTLNQGQSIKVKPTSFNYPEGISLAI